MDVFLGQYALLLAGALFLVIGLIGVYLNLEDKKEKIKFLWFFRN